MFVHHEDTYLYVNEHNRGNWSGLSQNIGFLCPSCATKLVRAFHPGRRMFCVVGYIYIYAVFLHEIPVSLVHNHIYFIYQYFLPLYFSEIAHFCAELFFFDFFSGPC